MTQTAPRSTPITVPYEAMSRDNLIEIIETQKKALNLRDEKLQWYEGILSNKDLPINQRLAVIASKRLEETRKPGDDGYYRAHLPALADIVGISPSTMSRGLKSLADCTNALEHRSEPDKNEPYKNIVFIRPTDLLARPREIVPVKEIKRHGGDHRVFCQSCGSEDIVEKKQHICRGCGAVVKAFDLREINAPLHLATSEEEQLLSSVRVEEVPPLQDAMGLIEAPTPLLEEISNEAPHCNLQPLLLHTVSLCTVLSALDELKTLPIWTCHRAKRPYNAKNDLPASSTDESTWTTYEQAQAKYERSRSWAKPYNGIGFMCNGKYTVIDLDHCIQDGVISENAQRILARFPSYTEVSQSGTGLHIIVRGTVPSGRKNADLGIELYCKDRFMVWTGNHLAGSLEETIAGNQAELDALYTEIAPPEKSPRLVPYCVSTTLPLLSDEQVLMKARNGANGERFMKLWNGDASDYPRADGSPDASRADLALCEELAYRGANEAMIDRLFRKSGLMRGKWDKHPTYAKETIRRAIGKRIAS